MERGDAVMEEEAAVNYSLAGRAREYVRDFANIERVVEWMDVVFDKVRQNIDHADNSNASIKDMIRRGEHLAATHNNLKRQVDAAPFKAIIYQPMIWITIMQLLDIKRELYRANYKSIPSEEQNAPYYLRRYAFYLLLFPPRYQVPARRLIALWIAEGLVHPTEGDDNSVERNAVDCLNQLKSHGLIHVVEENELMKEANRGILTCSIDDSVRDKLMKEANEAEFLTRRLVDRSDYNYVDPGSSCIRIHGNPTASDQSPRNFRDVISFLSFNTREGSKPGEDIGDFLQRCISSGCFGSIKVLDLERVFRPKLPDTLGRLINLKYLGLRWTYLQQLPDSVEELFNLQVLDLKKTYISVLPRSIWRMQFLTHLYLSEAYRTRFPQKPSQLTLTALHTLWGAFIDEDTPVQGGLDRLENVRNLGLSCKPKESIAEEMQGQPGAANTTKPVEKPMEQQLAVIDKWISKLDYLESLRLKSRDEYNKAASLSLTSLENKEKLSTLYLLGKLNEDLIKHLPASLAEITLPGSDLQVNPLYYLGKLPKLKMLRLLGQSVGCTKMHCIKEAFPQLKLLWIWKLENLEDLEVEEGSMSCLKELEIRNCKKLKALPHPLLHIQNLEIKLTDMPQRIAEDAKKINPLVKIIPETPTH